MDRDPGDVVAFQHDFAGVDPASDLEIHLPSHLDKSDPTAHRAGGDRECGEEAIPDPVDQPTPIAGDRRLRLYSEAAEHAHPSRIPHRRGYIGRADEVDEEHRQQSSIAGCPVRGGLVVDHSSRQSLSVSDSGPSRDLPSIFRSSSTWPRNRPEFAPTGKPDPMKGKGSPGTLTLFVDGKPVGKGELPVTIPLSMGLASGVSVGADAGAPVTDEYAPPFAFAGKIEKVVYDISGKRIVDHEAEIRMALARQ